MSLLGNIANKEIYNFLRTTTIKNSYFADQSIASQLRTNLSGAVPQNEAPYYKHVAGEYILKDAIPMSPDRLVSNPKTGEKFMWEYKNTATIYDGNGQQVKEIKNSDLYTDDVFDEMMYVTSLDTQEEIPFTLQMLHPEYANDPTAAHTKTLEAYKLPSRYYELLCEKYPNQVDLIKAIVYPVKSARAITDDEYTAYNNGWSPLPTLSMRRRDFLVNAKNFEILNYDDSLLEISERSNLTTKMREFIAMFDERWNVKEYCFEEYYPLVLWAVLWSMLPVALIVQRYLNIKTPFAHSHHIWDYLISKGLESYKGYLTTSQTQFLYKNIGYILNNRGKQQVTNLLIDELLSELGLNIKCKTIVLDTSNTLDATDINTPPNIANQCSKCAWSSICNENISDIKCPRFFNADSICKAEPVVLTEEFSGANKEKIIDALIRQYGYSSADAKMKYNRSMIWKDEQIEKIRSTLDRDQMVDVSGKIQTLDELIESEHNADLEPEYSDRIVAQQRNELRHIKGTYAPTKLLEITKSTFNPRYEQLCRKFLTETLLHLSPRLMNDGTVKSKVNLLYTFTMSDVSGTYSMRFGELVAALYLACIKDQLVDFVYDHCNEDDKFEANTSYFKRETTAGGEFTGNMVKLVEGTDYTLGEAISTSGADGVYIWAPKFEGAPGSLQLIAGHEILTDLAKTKGFNLPIPDRVVMSTATKFGKPVKQGDLIDMYEKSLLVGTTSNLLSVEEEAEIDSWQQYRTVIPSDTLTTDTKILKINDVLYAVRPYTNEEVAEGIDKMWEHFDRKLKVLGAYSEGVFFTDNGEIPVIPKYVRWYHRHLQPFSYEGFEKRHKDDHAYTDDSTFFNFDDYKSGEIITPQEGEVNGYYVDTTLKSTYSLLEVEKYIDVDNIIKGYVHVLGELTTQEEIGAYITKQYNLIENLYTYAATCNSIAGALATKEVIDAITVKGPYKVDLTGTIRQVTWPQEEQLEYPAENTFKLATYNDWFRIEGDLKSLFQLVERGADENAQLWSVFAVTATDLLTEGCNLPYLTSEIDALTSKKLRDLVIHLSSYKVAFVNIDDSSRSTDAAVPITDEIADNEIGSTLVEFVAPIEDTVQGPMIDGLSGDSFGNCYVYTKDVTPVSGKTYYKAVLESSQEVVDPSQIKIDDEQVVYVEVELEEGKVIPEMTYFELINWYELLGIEDTSLKLNFKREGSKWFYRTGRKVGIDVQVPANASDNTLSESEMKDTFLDMDSITEEIKLRHACKKYRKTITRYVYEWDDFEESDIVKEWLTPYTLTNHQVEFSSVSVDTSVSVIDQVTPEALININGEE